VRRLLPSAAIAAVLLCPPSARIEAQAQTKPQGPAREATDLDAFMERALHRRDTDRKNLSDYVLDEVEVFEVLGAGRAPVVRMQREYTWYVRDGIHVRSPLKYDGIPIPEADRRAYEERWVHSEENRRKYRTERAAKREEEGKSPAVSVPSVNEPRFISESYFMDFKFEPGNYYLAGKEKLEGKDVLKIDYLPTKLFDDKEEDKKEEEDTKKTEDAKKKDQPKKEPTKKEQQRQQKEKQVEDEISRKMDKTSQVTLWVDPVSHQIVKYTFDNVWMDFLPAGWLVRIDDLRANMEMGQPFPDVWLPKNLSIHAGVTLALGPMELQYKRVFSNYRRADVASKITIPKREAR
jgi:hypothetical protein